MLSGKRGETAGIDVNDGEDALENVSIAESAPRPAPLPSVPPLRHDGGFVTGLED